MVDLLRKKSRRTWIALAAALMVAVAVPAVVVAGGMGYNKVVAQNVYLRNSAMGTVRGTLYAGDHFNAQYISPGGWGWGYAYGSADKCGWTDMSYLNTAPNDPHNTPPDCGPHRSLEP